MKFLSPTLVLALALCRNAAAADTWRGDLPWNDLEANLSSGASLIDTTPTQYLDECAPEFDKPADPTWSTMWSRSNHGMIDQPSGLCLPHFFCAFEDCVPSQDQSNRTVSDGMLVADSVPLPTLYSEMNRTVKTWVEWTENPSYNLPSKVVFPAVASDVVAAIKFAKEHNLEVSVKNSGHSFTKASSKGNTLLINMNRYYQYATNDGVTDCDPTIVESVSRAADDTNDLSDQPCRLSLAKTKDAVLRVGGGENWDKVYRAVKVANEAQPDGYKYHAVGGAAGTVSPMGWTFSAGLSGTTAGRVLGFGVDQVVQIEMVLPNGQHVKFGPTPTEWEMVEGFDVPQTRSVTGLCNTNPEGAEDAWMWEPCPDDINFDDLWFAVRGGGGGTWGVITSMHLQLHEYMPFERIFMRYNACVQDELDETQAKAWNDLAQKFEILFLLDPTSIGVSEAQSNACGWSFADTAFSCFGEGAATYFDAAWKRYLKDNRSVLESQGIAPVTIDEAINCTPNTIEEANIADQDLPLTTQNTIILKFKDYPEAVTLPPGTAFPGKALDNPLPEYGPSNYDKANVLVPKKWILENIDLAVTYVPPNPWTYRAFGGKTSNAVSDGSNSLSTAHREAGYMAFFPHQFADLMFTNYLPLWYDMSGNSDFPAYLGANHAGINTRGPLKDDWSKACPLDWPKEERDEKCVSLQEAIWGTKVLKRLEEIKLKIDPRFMFNCNGCVGNNLKSDGDVPVLDFPLSEGSPEILSADEVDDTSAALVLAVTSVSWLLIATAGGAFLY